MAALTASTNSTATSAAVRSTRRIVIVASLPGSAGMVLEVALIDVRAGSEAAFEAGYKSVKSALQDSPGLLSIRMTHGIESPTRFTLLVEWESLDAHQAFRDSERFAIWRGGIGPHFAQPPNVEHFSDVD
jgi:heme-degrading monooxygenase HmoA